MKRVLIGCVTFDGHRHCIKPFLDQFSHFTFKDFDLLFIDNSESDEYFDMIKESGFEVVKDNSSGTRIEKILRGRNLIRNKVLEKGYDFLLFLDTDMVMPQNGLEKLVGLDKDIVTGVCLSYQNINGKRMVAPVLYEDIGQGQARQLRVDEVLQNKVLKVPVGGFGCCLIKKQVFERTKLRYFSETQAGEDVAFYLDAKKNGFSAFADTSVKCLHFVYKYGDPRNLKFDWRKVYKELENKVKI